MAQQMQEQNPELVQQLRSQMGRPPNNSDNNNPDQPPSNPGLKPLTVNTLANR